MEKEHLQHLSRMDDYTLDILMNEFGQAVWNYAYFLTKQRQLADDVTQDTFIKAFRHIADFRGQSSVKSWLFRIARNTALNYRRTAFLRRVTLMDVVERKGGSRSAEEEFLDQYVASDIWRYVLQLSATYREVIILEAKYELSLSEIAELIGVSVGTVKSRLHRARAKLAAKLKEEEAYETI